MKRIAVVVSLAGALCACTGSRSSQVPDKLNPSGSLRLKVAANGVQNYTCRQKGDDRAAFEWVFSGPQAELLDDKGLPVGKHYGGPTWELFDGSKVVAAVKEKAPSPEGAIPWLLLETKSTAGSGKLAGVSAIQRIDTTGGNAPEGGCDGTHLNEVKGVPYTANYLFFAR
jgi:hypothetical protein